MFAKQRRHRRIWWVVANEKGSPRGWHWDEYFPDARSGGEPYEWGGPHWIKSGRSLAHVQTMRRGDVVVAYQASEGVVGFTRLVGGASGQLGQVPDHFFLSGRRALRLVRPVPLEAVRRIPDACIDFEFMRFHQATVFAVTPVGMRRLCFLAAAFNPSQARAILARAAF